MENLLEIRDLHVHFTTYAGVVQAVRGVNLSLARGEAVALVGESGCGKSITAQSIMRLLPSPQGKIVKGTINFAGQNLVKKSEREMEKIRGNEIGMIFQDPMTSLNPTMTTGNQIMEVLRRHSRMTRQEMTARAVEMLRLAGIHQPERRLRQYPYEFSGGMRQRVMIAMALACGPRLLIADEPTTALDVTIQAQIMELMQDLRQKLGTAVILITHDLAVVAGFARRVMVMYAGKIVESGTARELFRSPLHPYTRGLLGSVPRINDRARQPLTPIAGRPPDLLNPPPGCAFWPRCSEAMQVCARQEPAMVEAASGHSAACWLLHPQAQNRRRVG
ncbi:ABC transporter ATP-binding protein [Desulfotomaculum copahuensis]|uniref:Peptide ABC transporter ATP-binding protein n=1 Tax=Desulfotomaculum copahuensis TaxID=1838280 RepID=A0A1B7LEU1_9FIRM|nr:ABC transporter ATP-binding protein [Desulfotomaculum copahuensis]OAT81803.1 peptide ABC transporter ATP-binding protein [Desulfotomaculum copahuensis]